jgi:hypothetical protein
MCMLTCTDCFAAVFFGVPEFPELPLPPFAAPADGAELPPPPHALSPRTSKKTSGR